MRALEHLIGEEPRFTDLNLERLLSEAAVSRTSFYKYFDSKVEVLSIWFSQTAELLQQTTLNWSQRIPTKNDLRQDLQVIAAAYRPRLALVSAVYETSAHDAHLRAQLAELLRSFENRLMRHLVDGQKAGFVNPALDPEESAIWLMAMAESGLNQIVGPASERQLVKLVDGWTDIIWFTVYSPCSSAQRLPT